MACFLVPAAEAAIVHVAKKVVKEEKQTAFTGFKSKLNWLNKMLIGGSALLAFEHVWHGEVTPWFPFLTAMSDPAETAEMLHEMSTVGVTMAAIITVVWIGMVLVTNAMEKKTPEVETVGA